MNTLFTKIAIVLSLLTLVFAAESQEIEYRASGTVRFSPIKKVKLYLSPELRVDASGVDKFLVETEVKYSVLKKLDVGASYKLEMNFKTDDPTEYMHRVSVYSQVEHRIDRFLPSLRIMYANYDEDDASTNFLRYRVKLDYDIRGYKIDPYVAAEAYQQLSDGILYKMRYVIGADWRFAKKQSIGLSYKLDDYVDADKKKHIVSLGYSYKF